MSDQRWSLLWFAQLQLLSYCKHNMYSGVIHTIDIISQVVNYIVSFPLFQLVFFFRENVYERPTLKLIITLSYGKHTWTVTMKQWVEFILSSLLNIINNRIRGLLRVNSRRFRESRWIDHNIVPMRNKQRKSTIRKTKPRRIEWRCFFLQSRNRGMATGICS